MPDPWFNNTEGPGRVPQPMALPCDVSSRPCGRRSIPVSLSTKAEGQPCGFSPSGHNFVHASTLTTVVEDQAGHEPLGTPLYPFPHSWQEVHKAESA